MFVGNSAGLNRGFGVVRSPYSADDLDAADCNNGRGIGLIGSGQEGTDDIRLTQGDFMDAAEVLISCGCPDERLGRETGVCFV